MGKPWENATKNQEKWWVHGIFELIYRAKLANITITHRIHGAAIYGNMDPINIPQMLAYIPAPWILWVITEGLIRDMSNYIYRL